ncbi:hypothetical protein BG006_006441 [Podila minutissima]|uniref:Uncharacterized protein n=1 Tax=Podila minutissima TaxID=64525 RepID=A0A9P5VLF4_9FUNG|nr:hypothetical protein BG006_006441 [Podila minutissima]
MMSSGDQIRAQPTEPIPPLGGPKDLAPHAPAKVTLIEEYVELPGTPVIPSKTGPKPQVKVSDQPATANIMDDEVEPRDDNTNTHICFGYPGYDSIHARHYVFVRPMNKSKYYPLCFADNSMAVVPAYGTVYKHQIARVKADFYNFAMPDNRWISYGMSIELDSGLDREVLRFDTNWFTHWARGVAELHYWPGQGFRIKNDLKDFGDLYWVHAQVHDGYGYDKDLDDGDLVMLVPEHLIKDTEGPRDYYQYDISVWCREWHEHSIATVKP